jgi:hypothetical protein
MTPETVSRSLSQLAKGRLIQFVEKGRREIRIPRLDALSEFVRRSLAPGCPALHRAESLRAGRLQIAQQRRLACERTSARGAFVSGVIRTFPAS